MKEILELIITNLVENKQEVSIEEIAEDKVVTYKVKVSKDSPLSSTCLMSALMVSLISS